MSGTPPPPGYGPYGPVAPNDGAAIAALILAIASFVICPVVPAIVALVVAATARKNIAASGGALQGGNLCQIATILAWVNIGLFVAAAVVGAGALLVVAAR